MKSCGCVRYDATYPCGHQIFTYEFCNKAKAINLLKPGKPTLCLTYAVEEILPNLEESCGSTCLTRPFQCSSCGAAKQVGWRCSRCPFIRGPDTEVWSTCTCSKHNCYRLAVGKYGKALCTRCRLGACVRSARKRSRGMAMCTSNLYWRCHKCDRKRCTPANLMKCGSPGVDGCDHIRCGDCRAFFKCNCKCGCSYHFVEGGPRICEWCIESCLK
ncbi:hypothetical protein M434DRAFT_361897 [Hypoxylon sp. CO27-5]|nr:hypothetical protein M434DRAFT_361897 [Hypoxylon sp. CO27-5]